MLKVQKPMSITQSEKSGQSAQKDCAACSSCAKSKLIGEMPGGTNGGTNSENPVWESSSAGVSCENISGGEISGASIPDYAKSDTFIAAESKSSGGLKGFFAKLKRIKHIEIYAAAAIVLVMVLVYFSTFAPSASANTSALTDAENTYVRKMEQSLVKTLSQIGGAGRVTAMVTAQGSATLEIAYNIDERTVTQSGGGASTNTTTTVTKTPVIVNGKNGPEPLILYEIEPKLKGIVVVASGAANPSVRLQILRAVQILVSDPKVNIDILY